MSDDEIKDDFAAPIVDDFKPVEPAPTSALDKLNSVVRFPEAVKDRIILGTETNGMFGQLGVDVKEGLGSEPFGFSPEHEQELRDLGIYNQPGQINPIRTANEAIIKPAAALGDAIMRGVSAGISGVAGILGRTSRELPPYELAAGKEIEGAPGHYWPTIDKVDFGNSERAANEVKNMAQYLMVGSGEQPMVRAEAHPLEGIKDQAIGQLPKPQDFVDATHLLTGGEQTPHVLEKVQKLWEERGIHPAEVVQDAAHDPVLHQNLLKADTALPEPYAGLDAQGLTPRDVAPRFKEDADQAGIATRYLPNGKIVPAPEAVATYLKNFGEEAGFNFRVGPEQTMRGGQNRPFFQASEYTLPGGGKKTLSQVYMPSTSRELLQRWYGMGPEQILYHEVGHAIDLKVFGDKGRLDHKNFRDILPQPGGVEGEAPKFNVGTIHDEMMEASKEFRPQLWDENPKYNSTPKELMADSIAAYLSNPERRAKMKEFAARYGAKLDPYLDIANRSLPKLGPEGRYDGEWEAPPGGGGNFGGGGGPGSANPFGAEPQKQIEGPPPGPDADRRARILDRLSVGEKDPAKKLTLDRIYTNTVDQFFPVSKARMDALGSTITDPYKLLRLSAGWAGKAEHMLHNGMVDFNTFETVGKSLDQILAPVSKDMDGFRAFAASARATELHLRGIDTGIPIADAIAEGKAGIKKYGPVMKELVDYQNNLSAYLRDSGVLSDEMYDAMLQANKVFVPFHVVMDEARVGISRVGNVSNPVKRIEGSLRRKVDPIESVIKNTYLLTAMAEKNFVRRALIDMLTDVPDGVPPGAQTTLPAVIDKDVGKAVTSWTGHNGAPPELGDFATELATPDRKGEVSLYRDGQRETWRVDEDIAEAMNGLNKDTADLAIKLLSPLSASLRAGAVLTPDFMARHVLRDFVYAFVTYKDGIFTPADMVRGAIGLFVKDKDFWDWKLGGGGNTSFVSLDRNYLQEDLAKLTNQTGLFTRAWNVVVDPKSSIVQKGGAIAGIPFKVAQKLFVHPLQVGTELATSMTHLGAYKKKMRELERTSGGRDVVTAADAGAGGVNAGNKERILEASFTSRDTAVDAARIGAQMHSINAISAFANIKIQDTDRIIRAFKDDPMGTGLKVAVGITLPSVLLWAYQHNDSRYQDLPNWERDSYWPVFTNKWEPAPGNVRPANREPDMVRQDEKGNWFQNNGTTFRLPKPFAAGVVFGSGVERTLDAWAADKPGQVAPWVKALASATVGDMVPNALTPALDWASNRSQFTGATLVPAQLEKGLPEYQYTQYTTETSKALGKVLSAFPGINQARLQEGGPVAGAASMLSSPIGLETLVRDWTGNLGLYALQASDYGLRKAGVLPDPPGPPSTLSDIPVVRAFTIRYPAANVQPIQEVYDYANAAQKVYNSFQQKAKEGDPEAIQRIQALGGEQGYQMITGVKSTLMNLGAVIRNVNKDPMPDEEKRQLIDGLYFQMIQVGHQGKQLIDMAEKQQK